MTASVEALLANRYGQAESRLLRLSGDADALFATYYGKLPPRRKRNTAPALALSVDCDGGEDLLVQRSKPVQLSGEETDAASALAPDGLHTRIGPVDLPVDAPAAAAPDVAPAAPAVAPPAPAAPEMAPAASPAAAPERPPPANSVAEILPPEPPSREGVRAAPAVALGLMPMGEADRADTGASEDDFLADMQSIFSGQKVYDPSQKKTVDRSVLKEYPREAEPSEESRNSSMEDGNAQAIFDRIAQSMQYAGAYDLGTVELENRFADFDRTDEENRKTIAERKFRARRQAAADPESSKADYADFIQDLDAIQKQAAAVRDGMKPEVSKDSSVPADYSAPLYDTGEHVMAGGDLYVDQLLVGSPPGVLFSYGEIVSMADFFATVDEMMGASAAELQKLKTLIQRSAAFYKGKKGRSPSNVSDEEWDEATGGRYLRLAESNYDHFAPTFLFKSAGVAGPDPLRRDHKLAWEQHHERALDEARKMALDSANADRSYIPMRPLIINAFGDHFLTDAFAAGHVINKQSVVDLFKARFYSGGSLNAAGNSFFEKVAVKAWKGDVAKKFKKLEAAEPQLLVWHPDINNAERFGRVLKGVADEEPDKVGNVVVKAIHDVLNRDGIDVMNQAGHAGWKLTGDGHLTQATLAVMNDAVAQSAANITDPAILASNVAYANYFAKVWAFVPVLTPASQAKVEQLLTSYVDPASAPLMDAAAQIITKGVDSLIKALVDRKALQPN